MRIHSGTLFAGFIYLVVGVAFMLEALGYWTLRVSDLVYVGPLALIAAGAAILVGSRSRRSLTTTEH